MRSTEDFLTPQEQEKIVACVKRAEHSTSGEIVPMIVSTSGSYQISAVLASLSVAAPIALIIVELLQMYGLMGRAGVYLFLLVSAVGCCVLYYLMVKEGRLTALFRHFLFHQEVAEEVEKSALAAFYSEGLYRTAQENGVLLYVSILERKLWILADRGIDQKVTAGEWERIAADAGSKIADGRACDAICDAVDAIAAVMKQHFPYQDDDKDELDNLIIGK